MTLFHSLLGSIVFEPGRVDSPPMSIILAMRRYLVMEEASAPAELNNMMSNIENNGAPWPYNQMDRLNWND